jgi:hypothetical protein
MMLAWEGLSYLPTPNRTFLFKCARWSRKATAWLTSTWAAVQTWRASASGCRRVK